MRKITSILMLLILFVGASWAQTTGFIVTSTNVDNPEHVYCMKNGNGRWMTATTGPTQTLANRAEFAFFAGTRTGSGGETPYKIYCVTAQKWLSYDKADAYSNGVNFAKLVESQDDAESWATTTQDGTGDLSNVYQFAPYNNSGTASKYMNWFEGASSNPNDNTNISVGLWQGNATADNGSCWIIASAQLDPILEGLVQNQTMVRLKNKSTNLYMTVTNPNGTNDNDGGVDLGEKITDVEEASAKQVFYLKHSDTNTEGVYEIQSVNGVGYYLQWFGRWGYKASATRSDVSHSIEAVDDYYLLHTLKGYVGSNDTHTAAGSHIYSNHGAGKPNIKWIFESLSEEEAAQVVDAEIQNIQNEYADWKTQCVGDKFGQHYVEDANQEALSQAETDLSEATTIAGAQQAMEQCKALYSLHGLIVGNYYRVKNTAQGLFLGINEYTLNMKHQAADDDDPSLIWKYEQDGDNYYLKNVYAGLYPQNIPGGPENTAQIGTGKEKKFTYALYAYPTDTEDAKWNIFFGGTQVNCESSANNVGNVNYWYGENAHYYIDKAEAPVDDYEQLCTTKYSSSPKPDVAEADIPAKIDWDETADVLTSPNEFAHPRIINNAIDHINLSSNDATQTKIHQMFEALSAWSQVTAYKNAIASHGSLLPFTYVATDLEYGTIILPINWAKPAGWTINSCSSVTADGVLNLTTAGSGVSNKPYIIQLSEDARNKKYQFIGYSNAAATTNQTEGLLTGVLKEDTKVPAGSYILANHNDKLGFYRVAEGAEFTAAMNKCYLTLPTESESRFEALFFDGTATGISSVTDAQAKKGGIYNVAGQRLNKLQKGLNIVNGKIVLVK